jgi:hypothetical protein
MCHILIEWKSRYGPMWCTQEIMIPLDYVKQAVEVIDFFCTENNDVIKFCVGFDVSSFRLIFV